jgi:hypothetical protein
VDGDPDVRLSLKSTPKLSYPCRELPEEWGAVARM